MRGQVVEADDDLLADDRDTRRDIVSPGRTDRPIGRDAAGTSSYQTLETTLPEELQSTSVPICSSALEVVL